MALDVSDQTFRTEKFADYKANRAPMPEELRPQIPYIRRAIEGFRIPMIELDRYEADDVMGTLARQGGGGRARRHPGLGRQGPDAARRRRAWRCYHTGRDKLYDAAAVEAEFGVPPPRVADVLALMGDTVDNVPGVPGIGEKGAKQLVAEYGSVEQLLERAAEISRKAYREGLTTHRDQALLSKELVDDPHRSADRARARPLAHRGPGRRRAARALRRARVPARCSRSWARARRSRPASLRPSSTR